METNGIRIVLSNIQNEVLKNTAEDIAANIVFAIRNKPIKRYTEAKGEFQSVANATGALARSIRIEYTPTGFRIWAYDYIDAIIYGRRPTTGGGNGAVLTAITRWIPFKAPGLNAYAVTSNIHKYGTSIWQQHRGKDSGLLANAINKSVISKLNADLASYLSNDIMEKVSFELKKMAA
jgi:hypothetical protein